MILPYELEHIIFDSLVSGSGKGELGSIYVKGSPGIGKSDIIKGVVARYNREYGNGEEIAQLVDIRLTICDPSDLRGMPFPNRRDRIAEWFPPDILPTEKTHSPKGILFFDDFTTAPQLVQAAAYQLFIQPHQLGNYQLPEGWVVIGAGNKTNERSLANAMPKPLANRMIHINYEIRNVAQFVDHWMQWALENNINRNIVGFLSSPVSYQKEGHLLYNFDAGTSDDAFATPRSWARVSTIMEHSFPIEIERQLVEGTIGSAASGQFYQFVNYINELPKVEIILSGENTSLELAKMELKYAMIVALANSIVTKDHMNNAIEWAHNQEMEFLVLLLRMIDNNSTTKNLLMGLPALKKVGQAMREMTRKTEEIKGLRANAGK